MKLGAKIFFCYLAIFAACFYYPIDWVLETLRTRYLEGVEDPLVDQANILAELTGMEMQTGRFEPERLYTLFQRVYARNLSANIYDLEKRRVDMQVYITDANGKIIFDSMDREKIGTDYSTWRDVALTLKGRYGARSTRVDPGDEASSVLHVAAPVFVDGRLAGVLTVAKPTAAVNTFLEGAKPKIAQVGGVAVLAAILLSLGASFWITRPIIRLTRYAEDIGAGRRAALPRLDRSEIGGMGKAFERMREALEGKQYVEQYVQSLTHEIKSPLSAIRGAAELLQEEMPADRRARFIANIRNEAARIQQIVDRLLALAALENRKMLEKSARVPLKALVHTVIEARRPQMASKQLETAMTLEDNAQVRGDAFLLHQAVGNLVDNAVDFSPSHGRLVLTAKTEAHRLILTVEDEGPGIPGYAMARVFEKFFSLQRPDSGKKGTGLGLNFVREVAALHGGCVTLENLPGKGARASLVLPLA